MLVIATSYVHSKLDYCNSLYYNLPKAGVRRSIMLVNFCGRGLVSWENRPIKSLNHDTRPILLADEIDQFYRSSDVRLSLKYIVSNRSKTPLLVPLLKLLNSLTPLLFSNLFTGLKLMKVFNIKFSISPSNFSIVYTMQPPYLYDCMQPP